MATYFLRSSHISRGKGSLATRAAAYRSGQRIKDERTGAIYDFSDRRDVAYKEVVLPSDLAERADMAWSQDRAILWNAMEYAGTRHNYHNCNFNQFFPIFDVLCGTYRQPRQDEYPPTACRTAMSRGNCTRCCYGPGADCAPSQ